MIDLTKIIDLPEDIAVRKIKDTFVGPILISVSPIGLMSLSILDPKTCCKFAEKRGERAAEKNRGSGA